MAKPTLCASEIGKSKASNAFRFSGKTQEFIAGKAGTTRQRVANFLDGANVDRQIFIDICAALGLDWQEIAGIEDEVNKDDLPKDIEAFVKLARERCAEDIQKRCGTMRVLDMEQPVALSDIYTDVNILEKITRNQRKELAELRAVCGFEEFDRWGLSGIRQKRVEGIEAVRNHSKLMILGKPGAGKTTFLKFLAMSCINGNLFTDRVPVFVTLKDFADAENVTSLFGFISRQAEQYGIAETTQVNRGFLDSLINSDENAAETLLRKGKMLVLLDGLDEVREKDDERVLREIKEFSQRYSQSQIVVTCRIAAKQYIFEQFTEVEVADFAQQQIVTFAGNWFRKKEIKAEDFLEELKKYRGVQELATSPLLLTLLCLAFEESGSFPTNRAELYKEGLDALLRKWDSKRGIRRDSVYKDLSVQKKEDMLSQIALTTFEKGDYFVKQRQLEDYICDYIRNTANAKTNDEELYLDSEAVLKSIEAQHGLFVERARGIYSFSHLTFHEYFAARQIVISNSPSKLETALQNLMTHITDKRWREVTLLSVEMAREADELLLLMKKKIDSLLEGDVELQSFLGWVEEKSRSINISYKLVVVRAFYFDRTYALTLPVLPRSNARPRTFDNDLTRYSDLSRDLAPTHTLERESDLSLTSNLKRTHALARNLTQELTQDRVHDLDYDLIKVFVFAILLASPFYLKHFFALKHARDCESDLARTLSNPRPRLRARELASEFTLDLERAKEIGDEKLYQRLQDLKERFPDPDLNWSNFKEWWKQNGKEWIEEYRQVLIEYRNIGHNWKFTNEQHKKMEQYYQANRLLVECLKSDCYVRRETRQEIEESMLLPSVASKR
ncbi:NACHT domain-containing protein [Phormidium tenue]|jgi:predicted NACHT family NTPase|uniref:NACHT domain-containing NTPase n=1 Tax=Phormidium tenue FACHB-1050 TaxID=2692857 RepID=A0ABR8C814_9CYAN|nr:NACHT domain-containing NTPase [Phormidium tenue]MBD2315584.1 NACHT domain-containing NTPase [Phormidium tenue FACHB-1050]